MIDEKKLEYLLEEYKRDPHNPETAQALAAQAEKLSALLRESRAKTQKLQDVLTQKSLLPRYLAAQAECGLARGDLVRVTRRAEDHECGWPGLWPDYPDCQIIGRAFRVCDLNGRGVCLSYDPLTKDSLILPYFVLQRIVRPEFDLKPFDRVLSRENECDCWSPNLFAYRKGQDLFCMDGQWTYVIPYEGFEHLAGQVCDMDGEPYGFCQE